MNVYKKLMQARIELQNTKLNKSGKNTFASYSYFELGDFLPATQTIFDRVGLCGIVSFGEDLATLTIVDTDGESSITITSPMKEANLKGCHAIQNLGAVETYTRRYLWITAMEIVEHDALDSSKPLDETKKTTASKSIANSVWDDFPEEEKNFLQSIAMDMLSALSQNNITEAHRLFYDNKLDNEERVALWSRFDSKQRSAIKTYNDSLKGN